MGGLVWGTGQSWLLPSQLHLSTRPAVPQCGKRAGTEPHRCLHVTSPPVLLWGTESWFDLSPVGLISCLCWPVGLHLQVCHFGSVGMLLGLLHCRDGMGILSAFAVPTLVTK